MYERLKGTFEGEVNKDELDRLMDKELANSKTPIILYCHGKIGGSLVNAHYELDSNSAPNLFLKYTQNQPQCPIFLFCFSIFNHFKEHFHTCRLYVLLTRPFFETCLI